MLVMKEIRLVVLEESLESEDTLSNALPPASSVAYEYRQKTNKHVRMTKSSCKLSGN